LTSTVNKGDGVKEKEFFAKKVKPLVPPEFFDEVDRIEREISKLTKGEVLERYLSLQTSSVKIEPYTSNKYLVKTEESEATSKGYVSPSMFIKYRRCARELAIEIIEARRLGGVLVMPDQLKAYLKGILVHRLFQEKYTDGETEVRVESPKLEILGYIDAVKKEGDTFVLIELKSSHSVDVVGAGLQVMAYMYAFADQNEVAPNQVEGYLVTREGTFRVFLDADVFSEYLKRLKKIVEIARDERVDELPPRLPSNLSSRCNTCPYRGTCYSLPDKYRSYDKYFEAVGFKKLVEKHPENTLFKYLNKSN